MIKKSLCLIALMLIYSPYAFSIENIVNEMDSTESETVSSAFRDYDSSTKNITNGQYIGGGIASILPGFGIGHAIQGRYLEKGWIFTATEAVTFGGGLVSTFYAISLMASQKGQVYPKNRKTEAVLRNLGISLFVVFTGLKIWEIVDAWMLPSHYKAVKESPFQLKPLAYYDQNNLNLGLSLQYKF